MATAELSATRKFVAPPPLKPTTNDLLAPTSAWTLLLIFQTGTRYSWGSTEYSTITSTCMGSTPALRKASRPASTARLEDVSPLQTGTSAMPRRASSSGPRLTFSSRNISCAVRFAAGRQYAAARIPTDAFIKFQRTQECREGVQPKRAEYQPRLFLCQSAKIFTWSKDPSCD